MRVCTPAKPLHVCVGVFVWLCVCVCMHDYLRPTRVSVSLHTWSIREIGVWMYVYVYEYMYVCMYNACVYVWYACTIIYGLHESVSVYIHGAYAKLEFGCMYMYMHTCMYVCIMLVCMHGMHARLSAAYRVSVSLHTWSIRELISWMLDVDLICQAKKVLWLYAFYAWGGCIP